MPQVISATQARNSFADIINRVLYRGEEFIVEKQGKPAILITKPTQGKLKKNQKEKMTGIEFLRKISKYGLENGPKNLAKDHDKYT